MGDGRCYERSAIGGTQPVEAPMSPVLLSRAARLFIVAGVIGVTSGNVHVRAQAPQARATPAGFNQPAAVLIWQGRILPIITDTIASIGDLGSAVQRNDLSGISKTSAEFAGELIRFRHVAPTPTDMQRTSKLFIKGLTDLSEGAKALALGLRTSSRTEVQSAATKVDNGTLEFQNAIDQIRRKSGPAGEPTVVPHFAGPTPTPIIRGLP